MSAQGDALRAWVDKINAQIRDLERDRGVVLLALQQLEAEEQSAADHAAAQARAERDRALAPQRAELEQLQRSSEPSWSSNGGVA